MSWKRLDSVGVLGEPHSEIRIKGMYRTEHRFVWAPLLWEGKTIFMFTHSVILNNSRECLEQFYKIGWEDWVRCPDETEPSIGLRKAIEDIQIKPLMKEWGLLLQEPSGVIDIPYNIDSIASDINILKNEIHLILDILSQKITLIYSFDKSLILEVRWNDKSWKTPLVSVIKDTNNFLTHIIDKNKNLIK